MATPRLFIRNLDFEVTEDDLRELFLTIGKPTVVNVIRHRDTGKSRGFGFVTLDTLDEPADCWRETLQGHLLKTRHIHIDYAFPREDRPVREAQKQESNE